MMEASPSCNCVGFMAVVAVSGSVALFALQLHKRLSSDLIKKLESELRSGSARINGAAAAAVAAVGKKRVRFAPDVVDPSSNSEEYRRRRSAAGRNFRFPTALNSGS